MIRVIIERNLAEGMVETYRDSVREMRNEATGFPGYVSGESLHELGNPHRQIIISTWLSDVDWNNWQESANRQRVLSKIGPMLEEPEAVLVLEPLN